MTSPPGRLNGVRTFVLWALAVVWFTEMTLWGLRPLSEIWTRFWEIPTPDDPHLATALHLTRAFEAAAKGALGVLAVYALRSLTPFVRSALFIPMALVPPLNVAFQFRAQGFPLRPTVIGAALSVILWETFFLLKDHAESGEETNVAARSRLSVSDGLRYAWFAVNALVLTIASALFLFVPDTGLHLAFPCFSGLHDAASAVPSAVTLAGMAVGAHLTALATATWIATAHLRTNVTVRRAVASASTVHAALLCLLPLPLLAREAGRGCATSSPLIYSIPLLAGWLAYAALLYRSTPTKRMRRTHPAGH